MKCELSSCKKQFPSYSGEHLVVTIRKMYGTMIQTIDVCNLTCLAEWANAQPVEVQK